MPQEHTDFSERWCELQNAQTKVKDKRKVYSAYKNNFQCVEDQKATKRVEVVIDNDGGAHNVQEVAIPLHCFIFHKDKKCENVNCPHIPWNTEIVDAFADLQNARNKRNLAFWNLFGLKTRVIYIQEFRKLKKEKKDKAKEVFKLYCEYTVAEGAEAIKAQEKYEAAEKEYKELVAQYNKARRNAWGRNK